MYRIRSRIEFRIFIFLAYYVKYWPHCMVPLCEWCVAKTPPTPPTTGSYRYRRYLPVATGSYPRPFWPTGYLTWAYHCGGPAFRHTTPRGTRIQENLIIKYACSHQIKFFFLEIPVKLPGSFPADRGTLRLQCAKRTGWAVQLWGENHHERPQNVRDSHC